MNLCLTCREIGSEAASGLARTTRDVAVALARDGHSVQLLSDVPPGPAPELTDPAPELPGVRVVRLAPCPAAAQMQGAERESAAGNLIHAAAVYREVRRIHEQEQPVDAVIAPLWRSEGAVCLLDDSFPTIVSCMTSLQTLTELDDSHLQAPDIAERRALERSVLARSRYLRGVTRAALAKTVRDYGLRPELIAVIGHGLEDRRQPDLSAPEHAAVRVLFVGRSEARKGADTLLAAALELLSEGAPASFTLAGASGDPSLRALFEREAQQRHWLRDAVRFAGTVSAAQLDALYAESDIVCVASRYASHSVVLVEAMMFGKAIVTCDAGGIGEVVDAQRDALVCQPGDAGALAAALRRLVADPRLRAQLGGAARQSYARRFQAEQAARRMQAFVAEVIASRRRTAPQAGDVQAQLEALLAEVLALSPQQAGTAAGTLLDSRDQLAEQTIERLRAAARATPAPGTRRRSQIPRVTAVVVTRNRPGPVLRALDSLAQTETPLRTIVVDNDSAPAVSERLARDCAARAGVQLDRAARNLGRAGGRNRGASLAQSELVLFLDDDAELMPGALEHLLRELDRNPSAGAVSATVVGPDAVVQHSGGSLQRGAEIATFGLIGSGSPFASGTLPASGPAGWTPGTAMLARRTLIEELPFDEQIGACFEDCEWCYRVALMYPDSFRRCREALVLHHSLPAAPEASARDLRSDLGRLASCARFYQRHGVLLGPWLFELAPELRPREAGRDLAGARLLMELILAKGTDWTLAAWRAGELNGILILDAAHQPAGPPPAEHELEQSQLESMRLREALAAQAGALAAQQETLAELDAQLATLSTEAAFLRQRHETLSRVEQGGWWRLRRRALPAIELLTWLRASAASTRARRSARRT